MDKDIWDVYVNSHICDSNTIWSGPNADCLPLEPPIFIISAFNPHEQLLSAQENELRNNNLLAYLQDLELIITPVIGRSASGDWQEASFAVQGIDRSFACKIAKIFNQRGIFEITKSELLVIDVDQQTITRRRPR